MCDFFQHPGGATVARLLYIAVEEDPETATYTRERANGRPAINWERETERIPQFRNGHVHRMCVNFVSS